MENQNEEADALLITVSGPDHPGITSELTKIIHSHNYSLYDMGQSVTHGLLSLSFVINSSAQNEEVLKDLLFKANAMGLNLQFGPVTKNISTQMEEEEKFILSCVSTSPISANLVHQLSATLALNKINIQRIDKVSPRDFKSLEISTSVLASVKTDWSKVRLELLQASNKHKVDIAFLKDNIFRRSKRLIVFDMDSTLIQTEVIDEMADLAKVGAEVRKITEQAMNGEIDFDLSLQKRVAKLQGLKKEQLESILETLPLTPGVEEFISTIKNLGYKIAVISGGFSFFANALKDKLGLDYAFANELEFQGDELTGKVLGQIVNAEQKATLVKLIAQQERISLEQVVAIGDGANDLQMLSVAGLGIAFHAKEIVKEQANQHMSHGPMTSILYFLGISPDSF